MKFLQIAIKQWPDVLRERSVIEAVTRRDLLIKAEAARLARKTDAPVIAAGSTGSIPATAELIATIARLPHGAVVLPGLDTDLDDESWKLIAGNESKRIAPASGHPQFAMQALLTRIGITRDAVASSGRAPRGRERLLSEALRPAAMTDLWRQKAAEPAFEAHVATALETLTVIEAANAEEEALAIAVALREAVHDGKTAALVTPDRALGRRVLAALARWNIAAEDSGGDALAETPAGIFARLAAETALHGFAPVTLLALLKHPLLRLDMGGTQDAVTTLERAVLRGPRPRPGTRGLAGALQAFRTALEKFRRKEKTDLHPSDPRIDLTDTTLAAAADLVQQLGDALKPFESLGRTRHRSATSPRAIAPCWPRCRGKAKTKSHSPAAMARNSATRSTNWRRATPQPAWRWRRPTISNCFPPLSPAASCVGRQPGLRVRILGPLEARLTESDRVVLGGLVEGTWPPESRTDAWLSRPMRLNLGLDLPERRIGLSAHDFAQLLGTRDVILTHAAKIAGTPTVPRASCSASPRSPASAGKTRAHAATITSPGRASSTGPRPVRRSRSPAPKPPRAARPTSLSVTEIEHWLRDPYTIYAKHILRLTPLDPIGARARRRRARHVHSQCHRRIHQDLRQKTAGRPGPRAHRTGTAAFRRAERLSRGARLLVAALRAHRALVRALGDRPPRRLRRRRRGNSRRARYPARRRRVQAARHRRPHRARRRRPLRHPRLQDRRGAHRKAGAHRAGAAAHA